MTTFTAKQRAQLAVLRMRNQRANVTVPTRQDYAPAIRVTMRWRSVGTHRGRGDRRVVDAWLRPEGGVSYVAPTPAYIARTAVGA